MSDATRTVSQACESSAEFRAALVHFINVRLPELREVKSPGEVDSQTPLFETGVIDSLGILHLIGFVERQTGRAIPTRMVLMKHFRTIDAICETFGTERREETS